MRISLYELASKKKPWSMLPAGTTISPTTVVPCIETAGREPVIWTLHGPLCDAATLPDTVVEPVIGTGLDDVFVTVTGADDGMGGAAEASVAPTLMILTATASGANDGRKHFILRLSLYHLSLNAPGSARG